MRKGVFIPDITVDMFKNATLESVEEFMTSGQMEDIEIPERPHGEWEKYGDKIEAYDIAGHKTWGQKRRCTKCGFIKTYIEDFGFYPFCPNCSALIRKEGESNETHN